MNEVIRIGGHLNHESCGDDIVCGLIGLAALGLFADYPEPPSLWEDVDLIVDAIRVLRPKMAQIDALIATKSMLFGRWHDAIPILRQVAEKSDAAYVYAMLALCLAVTNDPEWQRIAEIANERDEKLDAQGFNQILFARRDLSNAKRDVRLGGVFIVPESVESLRKEYMRRRGIDK